MMSFPSSVPWRVLDGFGRAVHAACRTVQPRNLDELLEAVHHARREGLPVAFRGAGRSYGDAALGTGGLVLDTTAMNRMLAWDPTQGIVEAEPGLTIEGLWRRTLEDGYWPAVVPGTMRPTLGGCLAMNVHGKNNFAAGPFGEHVCGFDLVTSTGEVLSCTPEQNTELFHAAIGGLGLLGGITRVRLKLKRVESGLLRVEALAARNLAEMFALFRERLPVSDYLVGWVDCCASGSGLGRGAIHQANYLPADEDPARGVSLHTERQCISNTLFGVPRAAFWPLMRLLMNPVGIRLTNTLKYLLARSTHGQVFLQSHVAFAFLLDSIPNWRLAYGDGGFLQYQVFLPDATAEITLSALLRLCQKRGLPSSLGVLKRHRPDVFLLSHALDGWSCAMDFRVTSRNRQALWKLTEEMTAMVLEAGGRFYFAKDLVLRPENILQAYGAERLERFQALRASLDPEGVWQTDLSRRLLPRSDAPCG